MEDILRQLPHCDHAVVDLFFQTDFHVRAVSKQEFLRLDALNDLWISASSIELRLAFRRGVAIGAMLTDEITRLAAEITEEYA